MSSVHSTGDTYVFVARPSIEEAKEDLQKIIGMKTNVSKAELICRKDITAPPPINVKNIEIIPSGSMKILGFKFHKTLGWDHHFEALKNESLNYLCQIALTC